ncbi:hypothetical protein ACWNT8_15555 (plasmid) [Pigmentibacter ruber]
MSNDSLKILGKTKEDVLKRVNDVISMNNNEYSSIDQIVKLDLLLKDFNNDFFKDTELNYISKKYLYKSINEMQNILYYSLSLYNYGNMSAEIKNKLSLQNCCDDIYTYYMDKIKCHNLNFNYYFNKIYS